MYNDRYGKCESRIGETGGTVVFGECEILHVWRKLVREEKKERWKFQMSMKLEKTAVSSLRSSKGVGLSRDAIIGVRKCCLGRENGHSISHQRDPQFGENAHRIYEFQPFHIASFGFVEFVDDLSSLRISLFIHYPHFSSP